jgi:hypothetical protein
MLLDAGTYQFAGRCTARAEPAAPEGERLRTRRPTAGAVILLLTAGIPQVLAPDKREVFLYVDRHL